MDNNIVTEIEEDDISLFIDELKSDDPSLKVNACEKLEVIAQIIGENRTINELFPYLIFLIEEFDNDEDFLGKLTEKLLDVKNIYPNIEFDVYLTIFETLIIFEDDIIRNKTLKDFENFINNFDKDKINWNKLIELILRLGNFDWLPGKISCLYLYHYIYKFKIDNENIQVVFNNLLNSDIVILKRKAIKSCSNMIKIDLIDKDDFENNYNNLLNNIFDNENEGIIIELFTNLIPVLYKVKDNSYIDRFILNKILNLKIKTWRIDYQIPEILIKLLNSFQESTIKNLIIPKFYELMKHEEIEVRSSAISNIYHIYNKINDKDILNNIYPNINDLNPYVKINYSITLNNLSEQLDTIEIENNIIPNIIILLNDPKTEIKISAIKNLDNILRNINHECYIKYFKNEFDKLKVDKNWKIRYEILDLIGRLKDIPNLKTDFFNLNYEFENDLVLCIRNKIIDNLLDYKNYIEHNVWVNSIEKIIKNWSENKNYIFRLSALQNFNKLYLNLDKNKFINDFNIIYNNLIKDKVPNIKFNVIKTILQFKEKYSDIYKRFCFNVKSDLKMENDIDIINFLKLID